MPANTDHSATDDMRVLRPTLVGEPEDGPAGETVYTVRPRTAAAADPDGDERWLSVPITLVDSLEEMR